MARVNHHLRSFGMSGHLITDDIREIEKKFSIELGHLPKKVSSQTESHYSQFEQEIRAQATEMAQHYELFYCLEQSIRKMIIATLFDKSQSEWWEKDVPEKIRNDVAQRVTREIDSGFSPRSESEIDYTNFGELSVIITSNWDVFGAIFSSKRAVERIMNSLNLLRGPIAHCSPLADDEIDRLKLTVKDWFRAMS